MQQLLHLFNFLAFNLKEHRIATLLLLHCWSENRELSLLLERLSANHGILVQLHSIHTIADRNELQNVCAQSRHPNMGVYVDMQCLEAEGLLKMASDERLFGHHYHWLLHDRAGDLAHFRRLFADFNLAIDADVTYIQATYTQPLCSHYLLYDVYNNGKYLGGQLNITIDRQIVCNAETCRLYAYRSSLHTRSKYSNRNRLSDISLRVSTVVTERSLQTPANALIEFLSSVDKKHIDVIARFGFHLTVLLEQQLACNFTYQFTDRWSVTELSGGSLGALINQTVELISTPFLATTKRFSYFSALLETGTFHSVCMFRTPRNAGIQYNLFAQPFSRIVWLVFFIMLAVAACLMWYIFAVEKHNMYSNCLQFVPSLLTTCLIAFGSACIQGTNMLPHSTGGRMAYFTLSLITFLVYNYYTSTVVSSLLSSQVKSKIKTIGQLADSTLEVGLNPEPFTMSFLNSSQLSEVRRFVQRKIDIKPNPQSVWIPAEVGVRKVRDQPGFVFIFEASSGYPLVEKYYKPQEICDLNEIMLRPERSLYTHLHRNSSYKELIRLRQLRLLETGLNLKHRRYWQQTKLTCFANNYVINVGMEYVAPLFIMLVFAYALVCLILAYELLCARYVQQQKAKKRKNNNN